MLDAQVLYIGTS